MMQKAIRKPFYNFWKKKKNTKKQVMAINLLKKRENLFCKLCFKPFCLKENQVVQYGRSCNWVYSASCPSSFYISSKACLLESIQREDSNASEFGNINYISEIPKSQGIGCDFFSVIHVKLEFIWQLCKREAEQRATLWV